MAPGYFVKKVRLMIRLVATVLSRRVARRVGLAGRGRRSVRDQRDPAAHGPDRVRRSDQISKRSKRSKRTSTRPAASAAGRSRSSSLDDQSDREDVAAARAGFDRQERADHPRAVERRDACAAIAPLIEQNGPLLYCLANAGHPTPGSYEFLTLFPYEPQFVVTLRYFRERGLKKLAYVVASDAGGQDAEKALLYAAGLPENKSIQIVAHEYFTPGDLSAAAQMERIKAAKPDVLVVWATGTPAGTLFRSAQDLNIDLPTVDLAGQPQRGVLQTVRTEAADESAVRVGAVLRRRRADESGDEGRGRDADERARAARRETRHDRDLGLGSGHDLVDALRKLGPDAIGRETARVPQQLARLDRRQRTVRFQGRAATRPRRQEHHHGAATTTRTVRLPRSANSAAIPLPGK